MGYGSIKVGTTATQIVPANAKRKQLFLNNTSANGTVYIGPDANVTTLTGVALYEFQTRDDVKNWGYWLGPIYGITVAAASVCDVRYWEVEQ